MPSTSRLIGRLFARLRDVDDENDARTVIRTEVHRQDAGESIAPRCAKPRKSHSFDFEASLCRANWKEVMDDVLQNHGGVNPETLVEMDSYCLAEQSLYLLERRCEQNEPVPPQILLDFLPKARTLTCDDWRRVGVVALRLKDSVHHHERQFFVTCCENLHFRRSLPAGCLPESIQSRSYFPSPQLTTSSPATHCRRVERLEKLWLAPATAVARFPSGRLLRDLSSCTVVGEASLLHVLLGEEVTLLDGDMDCLCAAIRRIDANLCDRCPSETSDSKLLLRLCRERWPATSAKIQTKSASLLAMCCATYRASEQDIELWTTLCLYADSLGDPSTFTDAFRAHPTVRLRAPRSILPSLRLHDIVLWNSSPNLGVRMAELLVCLGPEAFWRRVVSHCAARLEECFQADRNEGDSFGEFPEWFVGWLTAPVDGRLFESTS